MAEKTEKQKAREADLKDSYVATLIAKAIDLKEAWQRVYTHEEKAKKAREDFERLAREVASLGDSSVGSYSLKSFVKPDIGVYFPDSWSSSASIYPRLIDEHPSGTRYKSPSLEHPHVKHPMEQLAAAVEEGLRADLRNLSGVARRAVSLSRAYFARHNCDCEYCASLGGFKARWEKLLADFDKLLEASND